MDPTHLAGMTRDNVFHPSKLLSVHIMHVKQISNEFLLPLCDRMMNINCGGIKDVPHNSKHNFMSILFAMVLYY